MSKRRSKRNQKHQPEPAEPPALATPSEPDWLPGLIVAAGIIAYFTSFAGTYVLDDLAHIQFSDKITSLTPLSKFFLHDRRPIVSLSLALNYALGKFDEWGYHAMNLAIHLAAALTLFGIVRQVLLREPLRKRYGAPAPWLAATVALLFVLHPLQTQAVTYIIQRAESLMGLFYLLTIYCLVRGDQSKLAPLWYVAAVAACAAGMSTKAVMVTAPVVTLAFDRTFLSGTLVRALRRRWLFYLGLAATWALLFNTKVVQSALNPNVTGPATIGFSIDEVTWWQYALSQPGVILRYLQLSIWPSGQCLDYDWPVAQGVIRIGLPLAAIALLIGATCWAWIRKPRLGFLGVWFFVILSPTSSFVPIKDLAFEHRMYLPLAAVIVLIVFAGYRALERCLPNAGGPGGRFVMAAVVVALAAPLGIATMKRNTVYESTVKMYQNVLKTSPENVRIWTNLGTAWRQEGNDDKALGCYRRAVEIDPYFASAHNNIGATLEEQGRLEEALQFFLLALKAEPKKAYRHSAYAKVLAKANRTDQAIAEFYEAIRLDPKVVETRLQFGATLMKAGQSENALDQYQAAVGLSPEDPDVLYQLGLCQQDNGFDDQAVETFRKVLQLEPDHSGARVDLGVVLARQGAADQSAEQYQQVLRTNPNHVDARYNLAVLLQRQGKPDQAIPHYRRVLQLDAKHADGWVNLGVCLRATGKKEEALDCYAKALEIDAKHWNARYNLAIGLHELERLEEALEQYGRLFRQDPTDKKVNEMSRMLRKQLKKKRSEAAP